jgi:hypothetical protein
MYGVYEIYVGEDERIYLIILTEDHPNDTQARFPIVAHQQIHQLKNV